MVPELYYENVPESLYTRMYGYYTTQGYLMCRQFDTFLSQHFNVILSAKFVWPDMTTDTSCVKSLPIP